MGVALVLLSIVTALLFVFSGGIKVFGVPASTANRDRFGMSPVVWRTVGLLEWAGAAGVLLGLAVPPLGVAAAAGLCALMVGAILTRLRVKDPVAAVAGDASVLALAAATLALRLLTWL
jgi:uncharacterized membrane protein YphA (DoxX/SURF4 family)